MTTALANSLASPLFNATTNGRVTPNSTIGGSATDQWSQNWSITPIQDPGQLLRLRALYRFGASKTDKEELLCEYPLVQKAQASGTPSNQTTVNVSIKNDKTTYGTPKSEPTDKPDPTDKPTLDYHASVTKCPGGVDYSPGKPDPALLRPPICVICDYKSNGFLEVNRLLSNDWVIFSPDSPDPQGQSPTEGDIWLGHFGAYDIYVKNDPISQRRYSDFVILALAAVQQSTSPSPSSPQKVQTPAAATLLLQ